MFNEKIGKLESNIKLIGPSEEISKIILRANNDL